jgi:formylmethanofuran dehydrogenase subunit E
MDQKPVNGKLLKTCDRCGKLSESCGGVQVKQEWICQPCWAKRVNSLLNFGKTRAKKK